MAYHEKEIQEMSTVELEEIQKKNANKIKELYDELELVTKEIEKRGDSYSLS